MDKPVQSTSHAGATQLLRRSRIREGKPFPLGATWDGLGVNFALFSTHATKAAAVESISDIAVANLPALQKQDLEPNRQGECPVLCVAARTPLDEAAARLFGQLANAHGLAAPIKPAEALSTANIFRLETAGVALVCLSYLDVSSPAHMRYAVQRLRRKLPNATIMVGCWAEDFNSEALEALRAAAKADTAAGCLREAIATCRALARPQGTISEQETPSTIRAIR